MVDVKLTIQNREYDGGSGTGKEATRTFSYVNPSLPGFITAGTPWVPVAGYDNAVDWVNAVATSLNGLTNNTYIDSKVTASWSVNELINA